MPRETYEDLLSFYGDVMAGCDIERNGVLYRQVAVRIGPGQTEHELLFELVKEIADGMWDEGIPPALRQRARLIVYGFADSKFAEAAEKVATDALEQTVKDLDPPEPGHRGGAF